MADKKLDKREDKHAAIYFEPGASAAMKDLANKVRAEGGRTTLVWANRWRGPESILTEARAVIVQQGCAKAEDIVTAYRKFAHDIEIHYVDQDGLFCNPEEEVKHDSAHAYREAPAADAAVQESEAEAGSSDAGDREADAAGAADDEAADVPVDQDGDEEDADQGGSEKSRLED